MRRLIIAAIIILLLPTNITHAISNVDQRALNYNTVFYNETDVDLLNGFETCTTTGGTTSLSGSDNQQKAFNYFIEKGYTPVQAAGIVGNFMQESSPSLNPGTQQGGAIVQAPTAGVGFGIAQWTPASRQQALVAAAKAANKPVADLAVQLDFAWHEMNNAPPYDKTAARVKTATTIEEAVRIFEEEFERADAAKANIPRRIKYANSVLTLYGGGAATTSTGPTTSGCGGGLGIDGNFVFPQRTTQNALLTHQPKWCMAATWSVSCHHDYKAADIMNDVGTVVVAAVSGTVTRAVDTSCNGGFEVPRVQIKGDDNKFYYYTHLKPGSIKVHDGAKVAAGAELGVIGPTECAEGTSPHVHFQMSSVPITSTKNPVEQQKYLDPQPNLLSAFNKLPEK